MIMLYVLKHNKPLWIKQTPDIHSRNVGLIKPGDQVSINDTTGGWYKILNGYVYGVDKHGKSLFDSSIQSNSRSDIIRKNPPKVRGRFYDKDTDVPDGSGNIFPDVRDSWEEDGYKVTSVNNGDGTYTMTKIKTEGGNEERITYVYDSEGTLTTKEEAQQSNGYRDTTYTNRDGTKSTVTYEQGGVGERYRVDTQYDAQGNVISQVRTPIDEEHGALSEDQGLSMLGSNGMDDTLLNSSGTNTIPDNYNLNILDIYGIHGIPYQYMSIVDRAPASGENSFGRLYADRIVARMPLLIITPGEPDFMAGWGDDEKSETWRELLTMVNAGSDLSKITQREGRYYSFKPRWDLYVQYVAPLTQTAAHFLGIQSARAPKLTGSFLERFSQSGTLGGFRWDTFYNDTIHGHLNYRQSAAFYVHSETQVSDNFTNTSGKSQLEQKINSFSDMAREVNFMLGTMATQTGMDMRKIVGVQNQSSESVLSNSENLADFTDGVLGKGNFLESIAGNLGAVINGGKLLFPEIWNDSDYIKSYNITIKLRCPNPDPVSWYFDIWAPLAHLLPLVLPKQAGINGYISPFLVRAYFKGVFNCQMGIITNMTVTRGEMGNWTLRGLPASVDVNLTIKDLYSVLSITRESLNSDEFSIMKNIGILDYISNICGVNINEPDLNRLLTMYYYQKTNVLNVLSGRTLDAIDTYFTNYCLSGNWLGGLGQTLLK